MKNKIIFCITLVMATLFSAQLASAFCGFYVAKADTKLFNKASKVVLARHDGKTVITMSNDFKGDLKEFAMVVPVPTLLKRDQIHVGDKATLDHLDAYSSPRLVEYFDGNPCAVYPRAEDAMSFPLLKNELEAKKRAKSLGVTIEAQYTVGEYDILILSAKQSNGLQTWLIENGYKIPQGTSRVLKSYIKQGMKFFVAKVNLEEKAKLGFSSLRPLQVAFESPKFMLPIRLGMVNADGPQELFIYTLTRKGRVETTNYRTVKLPTGMELPLYIKEEKKFARFYKDMFSQQTKKEDMRVLFQEYAWDMNWCDPCAADPLSREELRQLGVFWLQDGFSGSKGQRKILSRRPGRGGPQDVFLTRLHVRYDSAHFPEDLVFQETSDRQNFQGRYILRHPWKKEDECTQMVSYQKNLRERYEKEAQTLASLTGWDIDQIREKMEIEKMVEEKKWYQWIWN